MASNVCCDGTFFQGDPLDGNVCVLKDLAKEYVKEELKLDDNYMNEQFNICYCRVCHKERGDRESYSRGKPPMTYAIPVGWCRFGLKLYTPLEDSFECYYRAYHGTQPNRVGDVLRTGQLCMPGDVLYTGKELKELFGHYGENYGPKGFDYKRVFVSPSIVYSGYYASPHNWKHYKVQTSFQVLVKPDTFQKMPETIGATAAIDKLLIFQQ
ncbi:DgyrCDS4903 [Dimorphilus gyrociliatus]|uniref:DgyrCDS4903 n=1 Tax=Dimorphilus gyrociliatus TaxID=2664684 RepID=A0A7I8VI43_9ANNE|nr:DgyrCDS4903 [Dimorphilus gyrociliatus]